MPDSVFGEGQYVSRAERDVWVRATGVPPIGYRATGPVDWFLPLFPGDLPCVKCRLVTGRWVIGYTHIGTIPESGPTYRDHVLIAAEAFPFCESCERVNSIAVLRKRQSNLEILESVRAGELKYLAELEAEQMGKAA